MDAEYITFPIPYIKTITFLEGFVYQYRIGSVGQSISINKMQKNEENYDKVIDSLLKFYQKTMSNCTQVKRLYTAKIIARIIAGKIKIMLSFPASSVKKNQIIIFNKRLKCEYPEIYESNLNKAVSMLRKTNYRSYFITCILVRLKYYYLN